MENRRGFTVVEVLVCLVVMAIMAAAMTIAPGTTKQTAEREAQRVMMWLYRQIDRADRLHTYFAITPDVDHILILWKGDATTQDRSFTPTAGCSYSKNFGSITYNSQIKRFINGGHISVHASDGGVYYVIIAPQEGRIRISDTQP
ncbi:MAG: prepilin-type N-terminal cleavage/methylation domain-containing protein [Synergistaceae bacterium]|nr:prepilin-type N-terminal cleavage/methylation domain-containing protein [Synergistaceae bacterium]